MADKNMRGKGIKLVGVETFGWTDEETAAVQRWWDDSMVAAARGEKSPPMPSAVSGLVSRSMPPLPPPRLLVPVTLLLALKDQIERDAVELESTTRWCRDLPKLIDQGGMPVAWEQLTALLKAYGREA